MTKPNCIYIIVGISILLCSCSQKKEMNSLMEKMLMEDHQEVIFQSDSIPLRLIDYYTQHGTANDQMRAYYLLGRVYDCKNNPILALRFYHEAIAKADTTATDIDYVTLSRAYAHSAKLFIGKFDKRPTLAIEDAKKALHYANISENDHMINISRSMLGRAFFTNGDWDSIKIYNPIFYNSMFRWWKGRNPDYLIQYKTFIPMLGKSGNKQDNVEVLYEIPKDSIPEVFRKSGGYVGGGGTIHAIEKPTDRDSLMSLSNIFSYVDMRLQSQARINRLNTWLIIALAILLLLLIGGYMFYRFRRERAKEAIKALNTQYSLDLAKYQALQAEMKSLLLSSKDKDSLIREKQQQIDSMQQRITSLQEDKTLPSAWLLSEELLADEVLRNLHKKASIGKKANHHDLKDLKALAHQQDPVFMSALSALDSTLDIDNLFICILTRFRFLPSELSILLDKSPQSITNRKSRLLKRLFKTEGGAKQFDHQINLLGQQV